MLVTYVILKTYSCVKKVNKTETLNVAYSKIQDY